MKAPPRSRAQEKKLKRIAARMILEGKSDEEIMKETGLDVFKVSGQRGFLRSKRGKEWAVKEGFVKGSQGVPPLTEPQGEKQALTEKPIEVQASPEPSTEVNVPTNIAEEHSEPVAEPVPAPSTLRPSTPIRRTPYTKGEDLLPQEALVEVEGIPSSRKIRLTPKSLMWFDWFKTKYRYEGSLSEFINDAIEDFFKSRDWTIAVVKREELA